MIALGAPDEATPRARVGGDLRVSLVLFVCSGAAALICQVAWSRLFATAFGAAESATAAVLAATMLGLGAGALAGERFGPRLRRPLFAYAALETAAAALVLASPLTAHLLGAAIASVLGGQPHPPSSDMGPQVWLTLGAAFLVVSPPCVAMGATLPALARALAREGATAAPRIGALYAGNTLGAMLGVLAASFALIDAVGVRGALATAAGLNAAAGLGAALLGARRAPLAVEPKHASHGRPWRSAFSGPMAALAFVGGAVTFALEVLWTRLLTHALGGALAAFGAMLAAFLLGLALGAALAAPWAANVRRAAPAYVAAQLGAAAFGLMAFWASGALPWRGGVHDVALAIALIAPAPLCIGAAFPLAVRLHMEGGRSPAAAAGAMAGWSTIGAVLGALLAAHVLLPQLGFEGTAQAAAAASAALAAAAALLFLKGRAARVGILLAALVVAAVPAPRPWRLVEMSAVDASARGAVVHYGVGVSATVLAVREDGVLRLRSNGLPEAAIALRGAPPPFGDQVWLALLPSIARPGAERAALIGFGGGVAIEGFGPLVRHIDAIELEPEILTANRLIAPYRRFDPLRDPRLRIVRNDARNALRLTDRRYDVIVSQPSHPWTAGASHLYTREFLSLSRSRLADDGLLLQWVNLDFVSLPLLRRLVATAVAEFPEVWMVRPSDQEVLLLASAKPIDLVGAFGSLSPAARAHAQQLGLAAPEDLAALIALDPEGVKALARGVEPNTDDANRLATRARPAPGAGLAEIEAALAERYPAAALAGDDRLDLALLGQILAHAGRFDRLTALRRAADTPSDAAALEAIEAAARSGAIERSGLGIAAPAGAFPPDPRLLRVALEEAFPAFARGDPTSVQLEAARALDAPGRAVAVGWALGARGDWAGLKALEPFLAEVGPRDLWRARAAKLRADWRVAHPEATDKDRREAVAIVDAGLAFAPSADLLMLRAAALLALEDSRGFVETARAVGRLYREAGAPLDALAQRRLRGLAERLDAYDGADAAEVSASLRALL